VIGEHRGGITVARQRAGTISSAELAEEVAVVWWCRLCRGAVAVGTGVGEKWESVAARATRGCA
jgi:hypothetical protein